MQRSSYAVWQQRALDEKRLAVLGMLDRAPVAWRNRVREEFWGRFDAAPDEALAWGESVGSEFAGFVLPASASDGDVCAKAEELAHGLWAVVCSQGASDIGAMFAVCCRYVAARGMEPPPTPTGEVSEVRGAVARMLCGQWWRRQLRKHHGRAVEAAAIRLGYVHLRAGKYCSDVAVQQRVEQKRRNAQALADVELENQHGDVFSLADLAERSNANPRIRRAELMTRIAGFELVARDLGHEALFVTVTCPSRFHAVKSATCEINPAWGGGLRETPRQAQDHLNKCWQRLRASLGRRKVSIYGFRITEPHHDGCPHWHLLLFMRPDDKYVICEGFKRYFLDDHAPEEEGAWRVRVSFDGVAMDDVDSAAGYIVAYVSKNIDGYKVQHDLFGGCAVEGAVRVDAWAARWGHRQFQQIGGAPVGQWREFRRMKKEDAEKNEVILSVWHATEMARQDEKGTAKKAWAEYVRLQGGPTVKRVDLRVLLAKSIEGEKFDPVAGGFVAAPATRYGEVARKAVYGLMCAKTGAVAVSRNYKWEQVCGVKGVGDIGGAGRLGIDDGGLLAGREVLRKKANAGYADVMRKREAFGVCWDGLKGFDFGVGVKVLPLPWTRVNNCTGVGDAGGAGGGEKVGAGRVWADVSSGDYAFGKDGRTYRSAGAEKGGG